uniref:Uncharacterized protein n=1 Tax=Ceratitis capitata TaxID=7213 RepID=W8ARV6_CERCA
MRERNYDFYRRSNEQFAYEPQQHIERRLLDRQRNKSERNNGSNESKCNKTNNSLTQNDDEAILLSNDSDDDDVENGEDGETSNSTDKMARDYSKEVAKFLHFDDTNGAQALKQHDDKVDSNAEILVAKVKEEENEIMEDVEATTAASSKCQKVEEPSKSLTEPQATLNNNKCNNDNNTPMTMTPPCAEHEGENEQIKNVASCGNVAQHIAQAVME